MRPLTTPPSRVAVFRALQLGDMLAVVPALRALRHAWPAARITLIGLPWAREFVRRFGYCDELLEFPGLPGMPERIPDARALPAFYAAARERRFDLALQMHGSGTLTNGIVARLGARRMAGFRPDAASAPEDFLVWDPHEPERERYLRLADSLGVPRHGEQLEFPVDARESRAAHALLAQALPFASRAYVCIHPGARLPSRRWPAARFAAVADAMAARGYTIVLTGTEEEAPLGAAVRAAMRFPAADLIGKTSLGTLAAILRDAHLLICNDTGTSHVANAMRTPTVVISSGGDPQRWQPMDRRTCRVLWHDTACRPCSHAVCPTRHECAAGVDSDAVLDAACGLLREGERDAA